MINSTNGISTVKERERESKKRWKEQTGLVQGGECWAVYRA